MHVTKVVYLFTKNSEQLYFNFSDFSTIYYLFYKFAVFENKRKRKQTFASRPLDFYLLLTVGPWPGWETEEGRVAGIRCGGAPEAWEKWGKSSTASRGTQGWARLGLGMAGAAAPRRAAAGGGGLRRRRRSGGRGRRRAGRGVPVEGEEGGCGGCCARGRVEEGAPRRPKGRRRPWCRLRPFQAKGGARSLALELRSYEGKVENVSELEGRL